MICMFFLQLYGAAAAAPPAKPITHEARQTERLVSPTSSVMKETVAAVGGAAGVPSQHEIVPRPSVHSEQEALYRWFLGGQLIYDKGQIVLPIARLADPLNGTFDLSKCGDASKYLSIATGYKKDKIVENVSRVEVWRAPRFLIEHNNDALGYLRYAVLREWTNPACPVGLFWTCGWHDVSGGCDYLTTETPNNISANVMWENYKQAARVADVVNSRSPGGAFCEGCAVRVFGCLFELQFIRPYACQ